MVIVVDVKLLGVFQRLSGEKVVQLKFEEPVTVRDVVGVLTELFSPEFKHALVDAQLDDPGPNALILVGGKEVGVLRGLETVVDGLGEVVFVPRVHGG